MPTPEKEILEVLPKTGALLYEKNSPTEVLCKPKLLPIKSTTLVKLEELESKTESVVQGGAGAGR